MCTEEEKALEISGSTPNQHLEIRRDIEIGKET